MIKKTISFLTIVALFLGTMITINAQEDTSYEMWEDMMFTPDNTKLKILQDNIRKHNETYHKSGPHKATVYNIATGPNAGKIVWEMGSLTYADLDTRPKAAGHDEDWRDNVSPYIAKVHTTEYWKSDKKLNNTAMLDGDNSKYPILLVRYYEVVDGPTPGVNTFFERVSKTVKSLAGVNPWGVYYNEFRQGDLGRHIATFSFFPNWASFDKDLNWVENFDKVNGKDASQNQNDLLDTTFKNSWDEIWVYDAHMSGD